MADAQNWYKVDSRELSFLLFEQLRLGEILGRDVYADWGVEEVRLVLDQVIDFAREVTGPLNSVGDRVGCKIENGRVKTPPGFIDAWKKLYEAGYKLVGAPAEFGGQGSPRALQVLIEELLAGSNVSFSMYPGLTYGVAELVTRFGTERQKKLYASRLFTGEIAGTMCSSEPQAGSDVGAATTTAKKNADGTYSIKGTKCWISGGDHDFTNTIAHLVLARVDGAPVGIKGLSLFIVPANKIADNGTIGERNDVQTVQIEHKMGLNGSATCVLEFGEKGKCIGELVGEVEHEGIKQMFLLMNYARIGVGIQGLSIASTAYLNALDYAKERKQGPSVKEWKDPLAARVAIIEHPDVRRMLLDMKARVEGIRALIVKLAAHQDRLRQTKDENEISYHRGQVDLLTPLVKSYGSDQAYRVCETAIQVLGGAGYTRDFPIEQYARDSKVFSIYEGTNHIQALDLVARKLGQNGGKNTQAYLGDIGKFVVANREHPILGAAAKELGKASEAFGGVAMQMLGWFHGGELDRVPLAANNVLEMMSELSVGWLLLDAAAIALEKKSKLPDGHPDHAFYLGKQYAALYFAHHVLPSVSFRAQVLASNDRSPLDIPADGFATT